MRQHANAWRKPTKPAPGRRRYKTFFAMIRLCTSWRKLMHDKALEESNAERSQEHLDADLPACAEFAKLFVEAEEIIRSSAFLKAEEEKNWIRASFVSAYLTGIQSSDFFNTTLKDYCRSWEEVVDAFQTTVPGDIRALVMAAQQLKEADLWMGDERKAFITRYASDQAREACIRVFGRHSEDVLKELVLQHSNCSFF